ncbi:MAG: hypothetical protein ACRCW1_07760, partial [Anaerotignaceae bacterium]
MSEFLNKDQKKLVEEQKEKIHKRKEATEHIVHEDEERMKEVLAEFDRESNTRHFEGIPNSIVKYMLVAFSIYALWMNVFSSLPEQIRRASFVGIVIFMAYMLYPIRKKGVNKINYVPWYDFVLGIVGAGCFFYFVFNFEAIVSRAG